MKLCPDCKERPIQRKGRCARCAWRAYANGTCSVCSMAKVAAGCPRCDGAVPFHIARREREESAEVARQPKNLLRAGTILYSEGLQDKLRVRRVVAGALLDLVGAGMSFDCDLDVAAAHVASGRWRIL